MSIGTSSRPFKAGVSTPIVTPFKADDSLDLEAWNKNVLRMAKAGMGLTLLGTNGEASHLADEERFELISSARKTLDSNGFPDVPLLVGTGTGSTHQTIKLCKQAKEAGADYAIVIAPGYFAFAMGKNRDALKSFFTEVIEASPIPIMIYNFPAAASGIDLDSDLLIELSDLPNCFGAKLTCAGIGKGTRLAAHTKSKAYLARHSPFYVLPGFADYLLPALLSGHDGCITGTGNIIPKTVVKLYNTATEALKTGDADLMKEAQRLQLMVTNADWCIIKAGIGGTKAALDSLVEQGLGGKPRSPLPPADDALKASLLKDMKESVDYEKSL